MADDGDSSDSENEFYEPQQFSSKNLVKMIQNCKQFVPDTYSNAISNRKSALSNIKDPNESNADEDKTDPTISNKNSETK